MKGGIPHEWAGLVRMLLPIGRHLLACGRQHLTRFTQKVTSTAVEKIFEIKGFSETLVPEALAEAISLPPWSQRYLHTNKI